MKKDFFFSAACSRFINVCLLTLFCTCASVKRVNVETITDLSGRWNDTDSRLVADEMVKNIVLSSWRNDFLDKKNELPVILVGDILNKSHEHIDASTFINDIEREAINSKSLKIIAHNNFRDKVRAERLEQNSTNCKNIGRELGANFMMFGVINTIVDANSNGGKKTIFYQVDLELVDLSTSEVVWIGCKKIKKFVKK